MKKHRISMWNPQSSEKADRRSFGCSVFGLSSPDGWYDAVQPAAASWDNDLEGVLLSGSYETVLKSLGTLPFGPSACIALLREGNQADTFLKRYSAVLPGIPVIGGVAAFLSGKTGGELMPESEDLVLFAAGSGDYSVQPLNIYDDTGVSVEIKRKGDREFEFLRILPEGKWQYALNFYNTQQIARNIDSGNFELITFSDKNDRNLHFRSEGTSMISGADLPEDNILRLKYTSREKAGARLAEFISVENALIFGCAGVRSLLTEPCYPGKNSLLGFMFGEIFTSKGQPMFGNLMVARLSRK